MNDCIMRGDIFCANLNNGIGAEQRGYRPVLIIQNNTGNKFSPTVIVAVITGQIHHKARIWYRWWSDAYEFNWKKWQR